MAKRSVRVQLCWWWWLGRLHDGGGREMRRWMGGTPVKFNDRYNEIRVGHLQPLVWASRYGGVLKCWKSATCYYGRTRISIG